MGLQGFKGRKREDDGGKRRRERGVFWVFFFKKAKNYLKFLIFVGRK